MPCIRRRAGKDLRLQDRQRKIWCFRLDQPRHRKTRGRSLLGIRGKDGARQRYGSPCRKFQSVELALLLHPVLVSGRVVLQCRAFRLAGKQEPSCTNSLFCGHHCLRRDCGSTSPVFRISHIKMILTRKNFGARSVWLRERKAQPSASAGSASLGE